MIIPAGAETTDEEFVRVYVDEDVAEQQAAARPWPGGRAPDRG